MKGHIVCHPECRTLESSHKVLETLKEESKFLTIIVREQVSTDGLLIEP